MYDLFLPTADIDASVQANRLRTCASLGYTTVAVVQQVTGKSASRAQSSGTGNDAGSQDLARLRRTHVITDDTSQAQSLVGCEGPERAFDIFSIQPLSERVLQQACNSLPVDVITLDLSTRLPFKLRPNVLKAAVERGIHFEVLYAPALREPSARRHVFSNAQALSRALRGKNIIVSSGARSSMELRGPLDVINMSTFFGLSQAAAQVAITSSCEAVLAKAAMRKLHRACLVLNVKASFLGYAEQTLARQQSAEGGDVRMEES